MTTQVAFDNPSLLLEKEFLCQRGLCCKLQLPSFCAKWRLLCLLSFKYFSTHGKNVYEQLTVYGVGGLLFSALWNDFMSKRNMFLLLYWQHNPFHLELNLKHRVFHFGCEVWRLGNISWGISLDIPQFLGRGYSVMWWV